jgi:hypothetical protein
MPDPLDRLADEGHGDNAIAIDQVAQDTPGYRERMPPFLHCLPSQNRIANFSTLLSFSISLDARQPQTLSLCINKTKRVPKAPRQAASSAFLGFIRSGAFSLLLVIA